MELLKAFAANVVAFIMAIGMIVLSLKIMMSGKADFMTRIKRFVGLSISISVILALATSGVLAGLVSDFVKVLVYSF